MEGLSKIRIHQSLVRPNLLMGGERLLVSILLIVSFVVATQSLSIFGLILGTSIFVVGLYLARKMALKDTQLVDTYRRHVRYQKFYPARAHPIAQLPYITSLKDK